MCFILVDSFHKCITKELINAFHKVYEIYDYANHVNLDGLLIFILCTIRIMQCTFSEIQI